MKMNYLKTGILFIKKHVILLIILDMIVASLFSLYLRGPVLFLKKYAIVASFLMIWPIMINTDFADIFNSWGKRKLISTSLLYHFIISPLLLFIILRLTTHNPYIIAGLMFISIMPASGMAAVWTKLTEGAVSVVIVILGLSLLLGLFTIPLESHFIIGSFVNMPLSALIKTVLILLLLPLILGWITRTLMICKLGEEKFIETKPYISVISTLGLLTIIFIAFGLKGNKLIANPILGLEIAVPMIIYYSLGFVLLTGLGKIMRLSKEDIIALNYGSLTKNRSMATAIAIAIFNPLSVTAIALAGVIAQIPMMLIYSKYALRFLKVKDKK